MITFIVNDKPVTVNEKDGRSTFKTIKQNLKLHGTKEGCGEGDCGACMVLVGEKIKEDEIRYRAINSCLLPVGELNGKQIITIEGLNQKEPSMIQATFAEEFASQCGFCTPGFIIAVTAFLLNAPALDCDEAIQAVSGNICRCTGYVSIRRAIFSILKKMEPHLAFYRVAEKRDQVFLKNVQAMMEKQDKASSLLVAGGFHTEGLTQTFKAKGISYVLVMPRIGSIPEEPLYREHMQGQVSWSNYFEVKDGKFVPLK